MTHEWCWRVCSWSTSICQEPRHGYQHRNLCPATQNTIPIFVKEKNVGSSNNNFTQEPTEISPLSSFQESDRISMSGESHVKLVIDPASQSTAPQEPIIEWLLPSRLNRARLPKIHSQETFPLSTGDPKA